MCDYRPIWKTYQMNHLEYSISDLREKTNMYKIVRSGSFSGSIFDKYFLLLCINCGKTNQLMTLCMHCTAPKIAKSNWFVWVVLVTLKFVCLFTMSRFNIERLVCSNMSIESGVPNKISSTYKSMVSVELPLQIKLSQPLFLGIVKLFSTFLTFCLKCSFFQESKCFESFHMNKAKSPFLSKSWSILWDLANTLI